MADALEVRIAHLEGAYEQIDKRLATVEAALSQLRQEMIANFSELRHEMNELRRQVGDQFRWIVGLQILAWLSILGTLLALLFRR